MKSKIVITVALIVIVGVAYWAYDLVRTRHYSGSGIMFPVGSGTITVTNTGDEAIPIEMRSSGRTSLFRVESPALDLRASATREGSGANTYYAVHFDLPPGASTIQITRGSDVYFITRSDTRIDAQVTRISPGSVRTTLIFAGVVILGALYYISRTLQHRWIAALRGRLFSRGQRLDRSAT
jgi:hypothetical protein